MSLAYWYVCDVNPVPWQIGPVGVKRTSNNKVVGWVGRDEELHVYKEAIKESLRGQKPVKMEGELTITCYFWRTLTESTSATGRKVSKSKADTTNMIKSTEDACQGVLFNNDKSNVVVRGFTIEQGPTTVGRVIITVEKAPTGWRDDVLGNLPDQIYAELFASPAEQLALGIHKPNLELEEDSEYANAEELF